MMKKPKKNLTEVEASITNLAHDGRGIARIEGKTVFVAGALPGEFVKFRYQKRRSTFDEGFVTTVLTPSAERQVAKCQHFGVCGGCSLQHISAEQQIALKQKTLLEQLEHSAHTKPNEILPPLVANIWGYRNKARMGVKYVPGKNKVLVGFREKDSRYLANLVQCEVLHPSVGMHLTDISDMLYKLEARDKIPQIEVAVDDYDTALIIRHLTDLCESDLNQLKQFAEDFKYKLYLQPKGIDTIHQVYPEPPELMHYRLDDYNVELQFEPYQFTQVNSEINKKMIARAIELLEVTKEDNVLDLFCGLGNFTLPIATKCKSIIGVEGDADSIKQAQANAALNDIQNAKFYCANLFEPPYNREWSQQRFDKVLLDPPRTGAKQVIDFFNQWQPQKIVYVSCNPATLARDAALIIEQGYTLQKAGVMDMFPHTQHVESIALFEKVKGKH